MASESTSIRGPAPTSSSPTPQRSRWASESFDTITIVAALNHIPNRAAVLNECRRVLRPGGRVVITMLTPRTSRIWHWIRAPWDADQRDRGMQPGEVFGFTSAELLELFTRAGFTLLSRERFMLGLNRVYVFGLADAAQPALNHLEGQRPGQPGSRQLRLKSLTLFTRPSSRI